LPQAQMYGRGRHHCKKYDFLVTKNAAEWKQEVIEEWKKIVKAINMKLTHQAFPMSLKWYH